MSHFVSVITQFKDKDCLVVALERLGFKNKIEIHTISQNLYGYQGDLRKEKANIIIRKKYLGCASNDIGFELINGNILSHISDFDQGTGSYTNSKAVYGKKWQGKLLTYYGLEVAKKEYKKVGWECTEEVDEKQRIRLVAWR